MKSGSGIDSFTFHFKGCNECEKGSLDTCSTHLFMMYDGVRFSGLQSPYGLMQMPAYSMLVNRLWREFFYKWSSFGNRLQEISNVRANSNLLAGLWGITVPGVPWFMLNNLAVMALTWFVQRSRILLLLCYKQTHLEMKCQNGGWRTATESLADRASPSGVQPESQRGCAALSHFNPKHWFWAMGLYTMLRYWIGFSKCCIITSSLLHLCQILSRLKIQHNILYGQMLWCCSVVMFPYAPGRF